jgi:SAM-dependent methyltransferase
MLKEEEFMQEDIMCIPQELLILGGAVQAGLIEALHNKPMTVFQVTDMLGMDERAVWTITEALLTLGYLEKLKEGHLTLSQKAMNLMYNQNDPKYMGFAFMYRYDMLKTWIHIPEVLKSGKPHPYEITPLDHQYFIEAMRYGAGKCAQAIVEFLLKGYPKGIEVLDVGGGPLVFARLFAERGARVTVLDIPSVVAQYKKEASEYNIRMVAGDFIVGLPEGPYDLIYLGNVSHILGEQGNQGLLKRSAMVLAKKGRIAIGDFVRDENPYAAIYAVNMLVNTAQGGTWTFEQYEEWMKSVKLQNITLNKVMDRHIITAEK